MCTVTYIPPREEVEFILTSNRDEKVRRNTLAPRLYKIGDVQLCFPKDVLAGGSWIAASNRGRLACLLNGGYLPHEKRSHHSHSRGRVLIDLAASPHTPMVFFSYQDLGHTEPFTAVILDLNGGRIAEFTQFVWDGSKKYLKELDPQTAYIWSSVTLYSDSERRFRKDWFDRFLKEEVSSITPDKVFAFHAGDHTDDKRINLVMQRDEALRTVSITQVKSESGAFTMKYLDLAGKSTHVQKIWEEH